MNFRHRARWQHEQLRNLYEPHNTPKPRQSVILQARQRDYGITLRPCYIPVSGGQVPTGDGNSLSLLSSDGNGESILPAVGD